jgi:flagellar motility protein MotE (MotC chaperone)
VYIALFFYEPTQPTIERFQDTVTTAIQSPVPTLTPLEEARQELQRATTRLAQEEARLLLEIDTATTTAEHEITALEDQIRQIEERRDATVAGLEAQIGEINATRADF